MVIFLSISAIGRLLIPRYFRSIFESGVKEMFYVIRTPSREQAGGPWTIVLDCDNVLLVSKHEKPVLSEVSVFFSLKYFSAANF